MQVACVVEAKDRLGEGPCWSPAEGLPRAAFEGGRQGTLVSAVPEAG